MDDKMSTGKQVTIKLKFKIPEDIRTYFSDNFIVQYAQDHFILSFYEQIQPPVLGTENERLAQLKEIKEIEATCISRIIVTPKKLAEIIKALEENYKKSQEKIKG